MVQKIVDDFISMRIKTQSGCSKWKSRSLLPQRIQRRNLQIKMW